MRILLIGDIVGSIGVRAVEGELQALRAKHDLDFVVANAENAEAGSGITRSIFRRLMNAGVDCVTLGDHIYRKREIIELLESDPRLVKPANFPPEAPGRTWTVLPARDGTPVAVISLMGRVFMRPVDCPFHAARQVLDEIGDQAAVRLIDMHAEATSDKQLMGYMLDGKVTAVLGTHTHVPTADESILPGGTAFQCDVGMTGPYRSVLGRKIDPVLETTLSFRPMSFTVASEDVRICGTMLEADPQTGRASLIERFRVDVAHPRKTGKAVANPGQASVD